jgi:hypothetical protein
LAQITQVPGEVRGISAGATNVKATFSGLTAIARVQVESVALQTCVQAEAKINLPAVPGKIGFYEKTVDFTNLHKLYPNWIHITVSADGSVSHPSSIWIGPWAFVGPVTADRDDKHMRVTSHGNFHPGEKSLLTKMRAWPQPVQTISTEEIAPLEGLVKLTAKVAAGHARPYATVLYCANL